MNFDNMGSSIKYVTVFEGGAEYGLFSLTCLVHGVLEEGKISSLIWERKEC